MQGRCEIRAFVAVEHVGVVADHELVEVDGKILSLKRSFAATTKKSSTLKKSFVR